MFDNLQPAKLRANFSELGTMRDAALAVSGPLRDERDMILAETAARVAALDARIADAEADLFDIDQARALIARALNGKTSEAEAE